MPYELRELPVRPPQAFDNSMLSTHQRCPRKAFYIYYLDRGHKGENWPIQFGLAYHKYREVLEKLYLSKVVNGDLDFKESILRDFHEIAFQAGLRDTDWTDPPESHRKSYLHQERLRATVEQSFERWLREKRSGIIEVLFPEQAFSLELPNGEHYLGRMDQILEWRGKLWVRDFKTTSRMGKTYDQKFDPNNQMTGYTWAAQQLSGRKVQGVIIETVYNTKHNGPEHRRDLSTRTEQQISEWIEEVQYEIREARRHERDEVFPKRTAACNDYGGCPFREACKQDSWWTREKWLTTNTIHSHWNPLNPDEEEGLAD